MEEMKGRAGRARAEGEIDLGLEAMEGVGGGIVGMSQMMAFFQVSQICMVNHPMW